MAFEADCGVSTVLEGPAWRAQAGPPCRDYAEWPRRPHSARRISVIRNRCAAGTAARQDIPDSFALCGAGVSPAERVGDKFEIRNPKFRISSAQARAKCSSRPIVPRAGKFEIRNSKFEISAGVWAAFLIPNS